jgi:hypothetical protein
MQHIEASDFTLVFKKGSKSSIPAITLRMGKGRLTRISFYVKANISNAICVHNLSLCARIEHTPSGRVHRIIPFNHKNGRISALVDQEFIKRTKINDVFIVRILNSKTGDEYLAQAFTRDGKGGNRDACENSQQPLPPIQPLPSPEIQRFLQPVQLEQPVQPLPPVQPRNFGITPAQARQVQPRNFGITPAQARQVQPPFRVILPQPVTQVETHHYTYTYTHLSAVAFHETTHSFQVTANVFQPVQRVVKKSFSPIVIMSHSDV